jgi:hypothetical protein
MDLTSYDPGPGVSFVILSTKNFAFVSLPSSIFLRLSPFNDTPLFRDDRRGLTSYSSNKGATHITPVFNEKEVRPGHYNLASSMGSSTSVSFKGNRQRTFENARQSNAIFLLPNTANDTPAPGFYSMKSAIGNSEQSISFKGRKIGPFQSNKGPTYG